ncbi:MAG: type IV pilus modification protein PilV [Gammaproteobacteria bacterium]|nr:type IV pilus modification protein PilV [Gammaproteobacteria bacterium]
MMNRLVNQSRHAGFGILEVLIALVVISIGILGLAGMQLTGVRVAKGSYTRSQAVLYAETIVAQMRANPDGVESMSYDGLDSAAVNCNVMPVPYCSAYPGGPTTTPECNTVTSRTDNDFFSVACGHWTGSKGENGILDNLPGGSIVVNCDDAACTPTSSYTVTVNWTETEVVDGADTDATKQVTLRAIP